MFMIILAVSLYLCAWIITCLVTICAIGWWRDVVTKIIIVIMIYEEAFIGLIQSVFAYVFYEWYSSLLCFVEHFFVLTVSSTVHQAPYYLLNLFSFNISYRYIFIYLWQLHVYFISIVFYVFFVWFWFNFNFCFNVHVHVKSRVLFFFFIFYWQFHMHCFFFIYTIDCFIFIVIFSFVLWKVFYCISFFI
jgi:hypothetical protein